jgi:anti-sigma regulatory factor (Ser/Thr protein kinase)
VAEPDRRRRTPRAREGRVDLLACDFTVANLIGLRHEVERHARSSGLAALALHRYVVAVNEVTTNAVRHGGGAGRLHLWRDRDELRCRVTDRGAGLPVPYQPRHPDPLDLSGRGLWMVFQSIDDLTIDSGPGGTTVTLAATHLPSGR